MTQSSPKSLRFDALTRGELEAHAPNATVVVPLGSTEQHGHHLPVGVDTIVVQALADRAVAMASDRIRIVATPSLPVGFAPHHLPFGGTLSLTASTYVDVLTDIGMSLVADGFRRIVFLNGHGGNETPMNLALDRLAFERRVEAHVAGASYWRVASEVMKGLDLEEGLVPGHAGHFETSLLLVLAPELVELDSRPNDARPAMPIGGPEFKHARTHHPGEWERSDGRTDDAHRASPELGARVIEQVAASIADFFVAFHRSSAEWEES